MKGNPQEILRRAQEALQDDGTRWTVPEMVSYLNEGQVVLATARPEEVAEHDTFVAVEGAKQDMPTDRFLLLDVHCNTGRRRRALTKVDRHTLESVHRDWMSMLPTTQPVHYMYSPVNPYVFHLYPPVQAGLELEATFARYPTPVVVPATNDISAVVGTTDLEARWDSALVDYVLYRAWAKDAEYGANSQLSDTRLAMFTTAVGVQAKPAQT